MGWLNSDDFPELAEYTIVTRRRYGFQKGRSLSEPGYQPVTIPGKGRCPRPSVQEFHTQVKPQCFLPTALMSTMRPLSDEFNCLRHLSYGKRGSEMELLVEQIVRAGYIVKPRQHCKLVRFVQPDALVSLYCLHSLHSFGPCGSLSWTR